ncbi:MAG: triose-phosphate isomerase family protein, partial [Sediminibacterium sp.]
MRKQIAAANWKMNLNKQESNDLLGEILHNLPKLTENQEVIFAVPAIYISSAVQQLGEIPQVFIAAQNCHQNTKGAFTGEISAPMYSSVGVNHILIGHSERREYFTESDALLAEKVNAVLSENSTPIFCCGEP